MTLGYNVEQLSSSTSTSSTLAHHIILTSDFDFISTNQSQNGEQGFQNKRKRDNILPASNTPARFMYIQNLHLQVLA